MSYTVGRGILRTQESTECPPEVNQSKYTISHSTGSTSDYVHHNGFSSDTTMSGTGDHSNLMLAHFQRMSTNQSNINDSGVVTEDQSVLSRLASVSSKKSSVHHRQHYNVIDGPDDLQHSSQYPAQRVVLSKPTVKVLQDEQEIHNKDRHSPRTRRPTEVSSTKVKRVASTVIVGVDPNALKKSPPRPNKTPTTQNSPMRQHKASPRRQQAATADDSPTTDQPSRLQMPPNQTIDSFLQDLKKKEQEKIRDAQRRHRGSDNKSSTEIAISDSSFKPPRPTKSSPKRNTSTVVTVPPLALDPSTAAKRNPTIVKVGESEKKKSLLQFETDAFQQKDVTQRFFEGVVGDFDGVSLVTEDPGSRVLSTRRTGRMNALTSPLRRQQSTARVVDRRPLHAEEGLVIPAEGVVAPPSLRSAEEPARDVLVVGSRQQKSEVVNATPTCRSNQASPQPRSNSRRGSARRFVSPKDLGPGTSSSLIAIRSSGAGELYCRSRSSSRSPARRTPQRRTPLRTVSQISDNPAEFSARCSKEVIVLSRPYAMKHGQEGAASGNSSPAASCAPSPPCQIVFAVLDGMSILQQGNPDYLTSTSELLNSSSPTKSRRGSRHNTPRTTTPGKNHVGSHNTETDGITSPRKSRGNQSNANTPARTKSASRNTATPSRNKSRERNSRTPGRRSGLEERGAKNAPSEQGSPIKSNANTPRRRRSTEKQSKHNIVLFQQTWMVKQPQSDNDASFSPDASNSLTVPLYLTAHPQGPAGPVSMTHIYGGHSGTGTPSPRDGKCGNVLLSLWDVQYEEGGRYVCIQSCAYPQYWLCRRGKQLICAQRPIHSADNEYVHRFDTGMMGSDEEEDIEKRKKRYRFSLLTI